MSNQKNEEYVLAKRPSGSKDLKNIWEVKPCDYPKIAEEGQMICESVYISVDPYLSSGIKKSALGGEVNKIGTVQNSLSVVKVVESKNKEYPVGTMFLANYPWRRYFLDKAEFPNRRVISKPGSSDTVFDKLGHMSALGSLGMPSQTAYYGCLAVGKFGPDDVLVVSGAAGAVGSVAGQIAKHVIKCKKVIGTAGGKEKCDLLVKEYGFDAAIDYKEYDTKEKMVAKLKEVAGEPVTAYFDNTGGIVTEAIFEVIGRHGRVVVCGQISSYNKEEEEEYSYPNYLAKTIYKGLTILGFVVFDYTKNNDKEFLVDMPKWIEAGQVKTKETIVKGFEKLPHAYEMLYTGANVGKVIVTVQSESQSS